MGDNMLEKINSPEDVKKLNIEEKKQLAEEIRKYIIEIVSENGGHLASNLGVVELTIALHSVFQKLKSLKQIVLILDIVVLQYQQL